jgi:hypothetical protein
MLCSLFPHLFLGGVRVPSSTPRVNWSFPLCSNVAFRSGTLLNHLCDSHYLFCCLACAWSVVHPHTANNCTYLNSCLYWP